MVSALAMIGIILTYVKTIDENYNSNASIIQGWCAKKTPSELLF